MAVISSIVFGSIAATSIYQIIVDDAVFMTTIHAVFFESALFSSRCLHGCVPYISIDVFYILQTHRTDIGLVIQTAIFYV